MRVLFKSIILGQKKGGGSTLSQQLVKNIFGRENHGVLTMPINKMKEAIIANKMENLYNKKEILTLYLNTVSFGEDTYGIGTACERFFSTNPTDIKPEETAVLIGMLKAPSYYHPKTHPERAKKRRNTVLFQLYSNNYITLDEKNNLSQLPLTIAYKKISAKKGVATHFREHLRLYLDKWLLNNKKKDGSFYNLYTDGLKIYTSIHSKMQLYAEESVIEHLKELQPILNRDLIKNNVFKENAILLNQLIKRTNRYQSLKKKGWVHKKIIEALSQKEKTTLFSFNKEIDTLISPIDSIKYQLKTLQAGFLVVNPKTGNINAWVGGPSYQQNQFDHVLSRRQVGSVFKPIIYAQALRDGKTPCDFISNQKVTYTQYANWSPKNSSQHYDGKYSLSGALTNSVNTISVKLCMESGIENVINLAHNLGIRDSLPKVPSLALGVAEISLLDLMGAYTAFSNKGTYNKPQYLLAIKDRNGKEIYTNTNENRRVLTIRECYDLTGMLQRVSIEGTASRLRSKYNIYAPIAAKTGTTQQQKDGWFMGYTSSWLGGVWVGADYPLVHFNSITTGQGANTALPIWALFYQKLKNDSEFDSLFKNEQQFKINNNCLTYKEDSFFNKFFKSKNKKNKKKGLKKKRKKKRFFTKEKSPL